MRGFFVLCVLGVLSACASSEIKVRCDGRLQPINPAASPVKEAQKYGATSAEPVDPAATSNPP